IASTDGHDFATSFSAVVSCLSNIGPGLNLVGPSGNFDIFSPHVKVLLTFLMLAGRLEFIPLLVMFHREMWAKGH
ncbi:MAG: TrkH family potassium uptake protein, partial [Clostridiales bacterium]|nr:TrkH family potassium uptake protein [Clostridiales bacterium]